MTCRANMAEGMRHRLVIQAKSSVPDGQGGFSESWDDGATVWAAIEPLKAYERFQAMQMQAPATHRITMRYRTDITAASRLKYGERILWVREVINEGERNRFLILKAVEKQQ